MTFAPWVQEVRTFDRKAHEETEMKEDTPQESIPPTQLSSYIEVTNAAQLRTVVFGMPWIHSLHIECNSSVTQEEIANDIVPLLEELAPRLAWLDTRRAFDILGPMVPLETVLPFCRQLQCLCVPLTVPTLHVLSHPDVCPQLRHFEYNNASPVITRATGYAEAVAAFLGSKGEQLYSIVLHHDTAAVWLQNVVARCRSLRTLALYCVEYSETTVRQLTQTGVVFEHVQNLMIDELAGPFSQSGELWQSMFAMFPSLVNLEIKYSSSFDDDACQALAQSASRRSLHSLRLHFPSPTLSSQGMDSIALACLELGYVDLLVEDISVFGDWEATAAATMRSRGKFVSIQTP